MNAPTKLALAGGLAAVGIGWAVWSLAGRAGVERVPAPPHVEPTDSVVRTLGAVELGAAPSDVTVDSEIARAIEVVAESLRAMPQSVVVPTSRASDLVLLFEQCLRGTVAPDFAVRCRMMTERGDTWFGAKLEGEREQWTTQSELTRYARFGAHHLEVRELYKRGVRAAPMPTEEGFRTLVSHPAVGRLPISQEPEEDKLDIIEVRLPMEKRQVPVAGAGDVSVVLVGYQFAWSQPRKQWIPWAICIYMNPNDVHYAIYF